MRANMVLLLFCRWSPGSYNHWKTDADTFASWGVDYVKIDYHLRDFEDVRTARGF